jgi:hypothetical protein
MAVQIHGGEVRRTGWLPVPRERSAGAAYHAGNRETMKQPQAISRLTTIGCLRVRPQLGGLKVIGRNFL